MATKIIFGKLSYILFHNVTMESRCEKLICPFNFLCSNVSMFFFFKQSVTKTKRPGSWGELSELCLSYCWWSCITQGWQIIWLPAGVEPAHLRVTGLAALCAQGTLNFYLTHVRSVWAIATSSSPAPWLLFSCSSFHSVSTTSEWDQAESFALNTAIV